MGELLPPQNGDKSRGGDGMPNRYGYLFAPLSPRQQQAVLEQYMYLIELAASIREIGMSIEQLRKSGALGNGTAVVSWLEAARRVEASAIERGDTDMLAPGERITQARIHHMRTIDPVFNQACSLMENGLKHEAWAIVGTKALLTGDVKTAAALSNMNAPPVATHNITINNQSVVVRDQNQEADVITTQAFAMSKKQTEKAIEYKEELRRLAGKTSLAIGQNPDTIDAEFTTRKETTQ